MGRVVTERGSILDHLMAARMALETADTDTALEHIRSATRLLGSEPGLCDATTAVTNGDSSVRHYRHSPSGTFMHVCTAIAGHDSAHLCSCGRTWPDRLVSWGSFA